MQLTYTYDGYKRLTQVSSGGTAIRTYYYDTNPLDNSGFSQNTAGRLTAVQYNPPAGCDPYNVGTVQLVEMYSYVAAGQTGGGLPSKKRLQANEGYCWQDGGHIWHSATATANLDATFGYNSLGKLSSITYPSTGAGAGPSYTYFFDSMERLSGMTDANSVAWVSNASYGPANELLSMQFPQAASETRTYNNLLQLTGIIYNGGSPTYQNTLNISYTYPTGTNNGKITTQKDLISGEEVAYSYDSLNRMISAATTAAYDQANPLTKWGLNFGYDSFGNLSSKTISKGTLPDLPTLNVGIDQTTNRVQGVWGVSYDAAGNQTQAPNGPAAYWTLSYDAENRLVKVAPGTPPATHYAYDARNKRIYSWGETYEANGYPTQYQLYFYAPNGQRLGGYQITTGFSGTAPYLTVAAVNTQPYFGGRLLGQQDRLSSIGKYYPQR